MTRPSVIDRPARLPTHPPSKPRRATPATGTCDLRPSHAQAISVALARNRITHIMAVGHCWSFVGVGHNWGRDVLLPSKSKGRKGIAASTTDISHIVPGNWSRDDVGEQSPRIAVTIQDSVLAAASCCCLLEAPFRRPTALRSMRPSPQLEQTNVLLVAAHPATSRAARATADFFMCRLPIRREAYQEPCCVDVTHTHTHKKRRVQCPAPGTLLPSPGLPKSPGPISPDRPSAPSRLMLVQCLSAASLDHGDSSQSLVAIV